MKRLLALTAAAVLGLTGVAAAASPPSFIPKGQVQSALGFADADVQFFFTDTLVQRTPCSISTPGGVFNDVTERTVVFSGPVIYAARENPNGKVTRYDFVSYDPVVNAGRICLGGWTPTGPSVTVSETTSLTANGVEL